MEDNLDLVPSGHGEFSQLPAGLTTALEKPLPRLRPLWLGVVLTLAGFFLFVFLAKTADPEQVRGIIILCTIPAYVYYFMIVHRIVKVLDAQPGWSVEYTPAAAVWKHFIPLYGVYFLYQWPGDVESYVNWRLGRQSRFAVWTFLGVLAGFALRWFDTFVGLLVIMLSLYFLYVPLRRALANTPPVGEPAPGYNGTLGLR